VKREFLATMIFAGIVFGLSGAIPKPDQRVFDERPGIDTELHRLGRGDIRVDYRELTDFVAAHEGEVNVADAAGMTPLHEAAQHRKLRVMAALLTAGAEINAQAISGQTALHFAAASNFVEGIVLLLCRGARSDLVSEGQTPYQLSLFNRKKWSRVILTPCIERLVRAGVVPRLIKNEGGAMFLRMCVPKVLARRVLSKYDYGFFLCIYQIWEECFQFVFKGSLPIIERDQLPHLPRPLFGFEDGDDDMSEVEYVPGLVI
jgi:hypothetical protein